MATIDRRSTKSGTRFRVRWFEGAPDPTRRARSFMTLEEAEAFKSALNRRTPASNVRGLSAWSSFREVAAACQNASLATQADTLDRQRRMLESRIFPSIGDHVFVLLDEADIVLCLQPLIDAGLSAKTVKNHLDLIAKVCRFGVKKGLRPDSPTALLPIGALRNAAPRSHRVLLSEQEAQLLVGSASDLGRPVLRTLLLTGIRWGELSALTVADAVTGGRFPYLDVSKAHKKGDAGQVIGSPKSRHAIRHVPLPAGLAAELAELTKGREDGAPLFTDAFDRPWTHNAFYKTEWEPTLARAISQGMCKRPRIHDLRHTFASWVIEDSSLYVAYKLLGHASSQTTADLYGGLTNRTQEHLVRTLDMKLP